ncbi:MAG: hypothetical protein H6658_10775 [Ardenticatenaceae bacterium]|nr:hypothetical protein [Ardenticatenaceae bacterium]
MAACQERPSLPTPTPVTPTRTPEPIVPTATRPETAVVTSTPSVTVMPTMMATATAVAPTATPVAISSVPTVVPLSRIGVSGEPDDVEPARQAGLDFGFFLDWDVLPEPLSSVPIWQMVRLTEAGVMGVDEASWETAVANHPGAVWIVGNEPDVIWQDNVTPERYAELYHEVYQFVMERDPTAQIAIGGVTQPTPLRLAYLDRVLAAYEAQFGGPMPVDIWTVHAFILREERDSWGVDIPPGMSEQQGILYEIDDHDDMVIFAENIRAFRQWMWERGYGDRPLAVTEYGILMPADYGFPLERVAAFMRQSFIFFQTARDETIGYAADDYRLVQWWVWYSLHDPDLYPTGNLYDRQTGQLTPLGEVWRQLVTGEE